MIENAKIYNRKGSQVYKDAVSLMTAFEDLYAVKVQQLGQESVSPLSLEMKTVLKSISTLKAKEYLFLV